MRQVFEIRHSIGEDHGQEPVEIRIPGHWGYAGLVQGVEAPFEFMRNPSPSDGECGWFARWELHDGDEMHQIMYRFDSEDAMVNKWNELVEEAAAEGREWQVYDRNLLPYGCTGKEGT